MAAMAEASSTADDVWACAAGAEETALAARLAAGDRTAFDALAWRHREEVVRLAHRLLGWPADAEDVAQDVLLSALEHVRRFRGQCSFRTWLLRIAINRCRTHVRRRQVRDRFLRLVRGRAERVEPPPESGVLDAERLAVVRNAVRGLPATLREAVVLHYLERMPVTEVADLLGLTGSAVIGRLHRARRRLRETLGGMGED